ncbi:MAG: glycosyltransferase [Candidatus Micrarchaeota archaeon]|nr:glycosyltransferase [Candidatus Micrarchaeota archaeon]
MQVGIFTDSYLPNTDGVVSSILALRKGLSEKGHGSVVFAPDSPGYKDLPSARVRRFRAVAFPPYPDYRGAVFPYSIPASVAREENLSIVHSKAMAMMAVGAYKFARRSHLPSVASVETMIPDGVHYILPFKMAQETGKKAIWSYLGWLYSNFDIVTSPSRHTQRVLLENGIKSEVIPSPVDTDRFRPNSQAGLRVREKLCISDNKVFLSVGRVAKEKNYDFLIEVAKEMHEPTARFLIVGKGPYLEQLRKNVQLQGVARNFVFSGFVEDSSLVDYYNAADAFVFPSQFETQGLTLLEALSCGKPACVLKGTPMEEIVKGSCGRVFSQDARSCAKSMMSCLQSRKGMAAKARKTALKYSIPVCTGRLVSLYKKLI